MTDKNKQHKKDKIKILRDKTINSIHQKCFRGSHSHYFSVYIRRGRNRWSGHTEEYRVQMSDLIEALNNTTWLVEEPKGNRRYPYLVPNTI